MEQRGEGERSLLVAELIQVQELVRELEAHLDQPSPIEFCKSLAPRILSSIEKSICIAKTSDSEGEQQLGGTESPRSATDSPRSENSDQASKDNDRKEMSKKRKTLPKWTSQFRVCPGAGADGPLDDGYGWRKYGQKDILGAKYPRGYYRCTHRNTQGCLATKQVQRTDDNPLVFDVTYHGNHTCLQRSQSAPKTVPLGQELKQNKANFQEQAQQQQQEDYNLLLSFQKGLKVKTQGLDSDAQDQSSLSFSFPSTPVSGIKAENHVFSSPSTLDNGFMARSFSPFLSPTTSESNYFSVSPCSMSNYGGGFYLQPAESDLTEILSAATSATNSPLMDMDFMLDPLELDPKFQIDASSFFS